MSDSLKLLASLYSGHRHKFHVIVMKNVVINDNAIGSMNFQVDAPREQR